jgi:hypothetical protein
MGRRSKQIEDAIKAGARGELFTSYEEELEKSRQRRANGRSLKYLLLMPCLRNQETSGD